MKILFYLNILFYAYGVINLFLGDTSMLNISCILFNAVAVLSYAKRNEAKV